jgi:hypothetical protein
MARNDFFFLFSASGPQLATARLSFLLVLFDRQLTEYFYYRHVTRLMALAYRNMFYPLRHIPSEEEARILNIQIYERATDSTVERKVKTREMLKSGELGTLLKVTRGSFMYGALADRI